MNFRIIIFLKSKMKITTDLKHRFDYCACKKHIMMFFIEINHFLNKFDFVIRYKRKCLKWEYSTTSKILFCFFILKSNFYPVLIYSHLFKSNLLLKDKVEKFIQLFLMFLIFIIEYNFSFFTYWQKIFNFFGSKLNKRKLLSTKYDFH